MEFTVISDTHNDHVQLSLEPGDALIHCGDAGTKGNYTEGLNFLYWFVKQPFKYKILVPGNHDRALKKHPELIQLARDLGIHMLIDQSLELEGIKFWGGVFTTSVRNSSFAYPIETRIKGWSKMPTEDIDILITHSPPHTILDTNVKGEHCGCDILLERVIDLKPKYHVFGHIHEHAGKTVTKNGTTFMNCANMNRLYVLAYPPVKLTYP